MYIFLVLLGLIPGIVIFLILNSIFDIYYFGWKGVTSTFTGCWIAGALIMTFIGIPVIIISIIAWIIYKIYTSRQAVNKEE